MKEMDIMMTDNYYITQMVTVLHMLGHIIRRHSRMPNLFCHQHCIKTHPHPVISICGRRNPIKIIYLSYKSLYKHFNGSTSFITRRVFALILYKEDGNCMSESNRILKCRKRYRTYINLICALSNSMTPQNSVKFHSNVLLFCWGGLSNNIGYRNELQWRYMSIMVSQITSNVYSKGCSWQQQRKHKGFPWLTLCEWNTSLSRGFPSQWAYEATVTIRYSEKEILWCSALFKIQVQFAEESWCNWLFIGISCSENENIVIF